MVTAGLLGGVVALGAIRLAGGVEPAQGDLRAGELAELRSEVAALRAKLELERQARLELADEVADLRPAGRAAPVGRDLADASEPRPAPPESPPAVEATPGSTLDEDEKRVAAESGPVAFDDERLLSVGAHPSDVERLRESWEAVELEKLYLSDVATREGWRRSDRYRREYRALERSLREELGEEDFDRLLYATGRPNRMVVRNVLDRSPAFDAGLQPGDVIVRYDGRRIFSHGELKRGTVGGEAGEFVTVEVQRSGDLVTLDVVRGPLGVMLQAENRPPEGS